MRPQHLIAVLLVLAAGLGLAGTTVALEVGQKAPDVTRQRIFLETLGNVLPRIGRKVIIDEKGQQVLPLLQLQTEKTK